MKPLRIVDEVLAVSLPELDPLQSPDRPTLDPARRAGVPLLEVFYLVGLERQRMEQLDYHVLFRWFVDLGIDDSIRIRTVLEVPRAGVSLPVATTIRS